MAIKTRTRNLVKHLVANFADRYEFFIENAQEGVDVIHVGRRIIKSKLQSLNFEITVDYNCKQVRAFGQVIAGLEHLEKMLGKITRVTDLPKWVAKFARTNVKLSATMLKQLAKKAKAQRVPTLEELRTFEFAL
ncbi:hypothetical protein [Burkholderia phage BCSR5]|nr:hypothetical protein [Burkholderia phage BCSR5]